LTQEGKLQYHENSLGPLRLKAARDSIYHHGAFGFGRYSVTSITSVAVAPAIIAE